MSRFGYLGPITVYHFLLELGLTIKPDRVICRICGRLGLIDGREQIDQAVKVGKRIAVATGYPIQYVDAVLVKYGQVGGVGESEYYGLEGGICLVQD